MDAVLMDAGRGEMLGHSHLVRVNGVDVAYGEMGEGPPLVLLHGLADSHRTFRRIAPALAKTHRVLMPDLPGHGWSGRPADATYDATFHADTIAAWMRAIGVERAAICGHSFGGGVALTMLRDHREMVERLALIAPGGLGREVSCWLRLSAHPIARTLLGSMLFRRITTVLAVRLGPARFTCPEPEEIERFHVAAGLPGTADALHRTITACLDIGGQRVTFWDGAQSLGELPPITVMWGDADAVVPFAHAARAAERLLHATVHTYRGVGHFPHLDQPERCAADLAAFLGDAARLGCRLRTITPPIAESWLARLAAERPANEAMRAA